MQAGDQPTVTDDVIERFDLSSQSPLFDRMLALRESFPEAFREDRVDFDALRRSLGGSIDPGPERFGLNWPGKGECMRVIQEPSIGTLVPMPDESVEWETTQSVIIEGENLEVLKLMQKAYYGKVKLIYIDPPYNTGKEFIYPDNFREGLTDYLRYSGQIDGEGLKLTANAETDGRYHSKWLSMIYPRLFLARNLLRDDGVICVSIDDHELHNLRAVMNELFGEENWLNTFVWVSNLKGRQIGLSGAAATKEYILCYARSAEDVGEFSVSASAVKTLMPTAYKGLAYTAKEDERGPYVTKNELHNTNSEFNEQTRPNLVYDVYFNPDTSDVKTAPVSAEHVHTGYVKIPPKRNNNGTHKYHAFRWSAKKVEAESFDLEFVKTETGYKVYTKVRDVDATTLKDLFTDITTSGGSRDIERLGLDAKEFDFPKPVDLIKVLCLAITGEDDVVMDFFAGSGTTAQAVMTANSIDGASRRFVLAQLPEPTGNAKRPTISSLTRERVRAASAALRASDPMGLSEPGTGFRAYRLEPSQFKVWDSHAKSTDDVDAQLTMTIDHAVTGATEASMLTELLLKAGFALTSPVEAADFAGVRGFSVASGSLIVCLADALTIEAFEAMVDRDPAMILVLDAGFGGDDELKVNSLQTVRARNQSTGSDIALRVV
jgi:adenine-specific DNA-methyltransferase